MSGSSSSFAEKLAPRRGFTLVELLVVMAILALLAVATLPALKGTLSSVNLNGMAGIVVGQVDLARQNANTRNQQVDMRIYQDPTAQNAYRIIALVITGASQGDATLPEKFVSAPLGLSGDIIFDPSATYSSLLSPGAAGTPVPQTGTESSKAPLLVQNLNYIYFSFLPNGTLNLDSINPTNNNMVTWCLTLRNQNVPAATGGTPAADFVTLLFDPATSRARVYQP